jgi:hypothetical protein
MESMALPGPQLEVTTTRAVERETPTAFTELARPEIQEKYWAQDVPMLLARHPERMPTPTRETGSATPT